MKHHHHHSGGSSSSSTGAGGGKQQPVRPPRVTRTSTKESSVSLVTIARAIFILQSFAN